MFSEPNPLSQKRAESEPLSDSRIEKYFSTFQPGKSHLIILAAVNYENREVTPANRTVH